MGQHRVALLVRDPRRLTGFTAALDCLAAQGSVVQLFALGAAAENPGQGLERWDKCPEFLAAERYTSADGPVRTCGFHRLDTRQIAALIRRADVVITL